MDNAELRQALFNRLGGLCVFSAIGIKGVDNMVDSIVQAVGDLGYVKVGENEFVDVRCSNCKYEEDCPRWLGGLMEANLHSCSEGVLKGVPVVAKSATGEEE